MTEQEVMNKIEEDGFFWLDPPMFKSAGEAVNSLHAQGKIQSLREAEIDFMNEDYCYILAGEPQIEVVTVRKSSYLKKKRRSDER